MGDGLHFDPQSDNEPVGTHPKEEGSVARGQRTRQLTELKVMSADTQSQSFNI